MTGLIGAGADLASTTIGTVFTDLAEVISAALMLTGLAAVAWGIRAAVRDWKRASLIIAEEQAVKDKPDPWAEAVTAVVADLGECPWCEDPHCIDSWKCTCGEPCGKGYCKPREEAVP